MSRFDTRTDKQITKVRQEVQPKNTLNADRKWENVFKDFLHANDMNNDFYAFDEQTLNDWLSKLWFRARQKQIKEELKENLPGKNYRANSLKSMRYAISRLLAKTEKKFDIINSDKFVQSQRAFEDAIKELKILGLGYVVSHVEILPAGELNNLITTVLTIKFSNEPYTKVAKTNSLNEMSLRIAKLSKDLRSYMM